MDTGNGARIALAAAAIPLLGAAGVLLVLGGAGANASPSSAVCGGAGTGQTIAGVTVDAEQMGNASTIVSVVAGRHLPSFAADVAVTNDSGLMHVAAAIGTPTVAIFGPTSPWHWKPLNPVAAILEPPGDELARQRARLEGNAAVSHRHSADVTVQTVLTTVHHVLNQTS